MFKRLGNLPTRTDISRGSFLHSGENLTYVLKTLGAPEKQRNFINEDSATEFAAGAPPPPSSSKLSLAE